MALAKRIGGAHISTTTRGRSTQVDTLDRILDGFGTKLDGVLEIVVDPEEFIQRLLKRAETSSPRSPDGSTNG